MNERCACFHGIGNSYSSIRAGVRSLVTLISGALCLNDTSSARTGNNYGPKVLALVGTEPGDEVSPWFYA